MHLRRVCFLAGSDYESGEKMKARGKTLSVRRVDDVPETFLRFPDCFQRHRPIVPRIFQWECFWSITNLPIPFLHSPAIFFFWRDRRDVNGRAPRNEVRFGRGGRAGEEPTRNLRFQEISP